MSNTKEPQQIGFRLSAIDTEQFAVLEENYEEGKDIDLGVGVNFSINPEEKTIGTHFSVRFMHDEKEVFLLLDTVCFFKVDPEKWELFISDEKTKITFPKGFATHLAVLTIGTTRGIFYEKLKDNPPFDQYLLPAINLTNLVEEDIEIDLQEK